MATRRDVVKTVGIVGTTAAFGGFKAAALGDEGVSQAEHGPDVRQADIASVRFVHAVPDAPPVDLLVNDFEVLDEFAYRQVSPYAGLRRGIYDFETRVDTGDSIVPGPDTFRNLDSGDYTVVAAGSLHRGPRPDLLVFEDDNSPVAHDRARFRLIHVSPDADDLNVRVEGAGRLARRLDFEDATDYVTVPAGTVDLTLTLTGRRGRGRRHNRRHTVTLALAGGATYTIFAVGFLTDTEGELTVGGEQGFALLPVVDDITVRRRPFLRDVYPRRRGRGPRRGRRGRWDNGNPWGRDDGPWSGWGGGRDGVGPWGGGRDGVGPWGGGRDGVGPWGGGRGGVGPWGPSGDGE
ncbi:DUF4397 domain-containing protein [Haloarchaeobius sp. TZWWS8]|uniref:DUF4397 domain-containing protein n=1 Tax=Haloarchaeobius sp. TZWWS8 TaxID=3446121 RepID=UPI003EB6EA54